VRGLAYRGFTLDLRYDSTQATFHVVEARTRPFGARRLRVWRLAHGCEARSCGEVVGVLARAGQRVAIELPASILLA
jgi:hypothetical protein